jgi:hypothetical protein
MAKIANVALTNTFETWRTRSNQAFDRLSQFAINNSSLYANNITANVSFTSTGLLTASGRATVGTNLTVSGNTTLGAAGKTVNLPGSLLQLNGTDIRVTFAQNTYVKTTLANTNLRVNLINTNLTGTNTALRTLISDRLQLANAAALYTKVSSDNTWTGIQTFNGSTSKIATVLTNAAEPSTVSATAATGTIAYDVTTQSVLYYTTSASANWTVNFRGSSGTSLNTLMTTGQMITVAFLVTQGATAYYNNAVQVDGASVTPKYQGGTAWSAGNASGVDVYTYTILKTGSAAFTIFASQTQFK